MATEFATPGPFAVKDCALIALATGKQATNLRELRDGIESVPPGSIYYHFWGGHLAARSSEMKYGNDFAAWARFNLHHMRAAERLALVDPMEPSAIEDLRRELLDVVEELLYESSIVQSVEPGDELDFITSQIIVFDTGTRITRPEELAAAIGKMSLSSIFYHFIDARRRTPERVDDFRSWLLLQGGRHEALAVALSHVDPYFSTLPELRDKLSALFLANLGGAP